MIKISSISALGFIILLVVASSIPRDWKDYILISSGLAIIVISILLRKELHKVIRIVHGVEEVKTDTYVENNP